MPRDNRCVIWRMFVFMSVVVTMWGSVINCSSYYSDLNIQTAPFWGIKQFIPSLASTFGLCYR